MSVNAACVSLFDPEPESVEFKYLVNMENRRNNIAAHLTRLPLNLYCGLNVMLKMQTILA